jgi:hypothetical protein
MGEEWKTLADFPDYEMNGLTDIRRKGHDHLLTVTPVGLGLQTVSLIGKDGKTTTRSVGKLYRETFPEKHT